MDTELLKVHCKSDIDFRKTQSYLDTNAIPMKPWAQRNSSNVKLHWGLKLEELEEYTEAQLIIDALKENNFTTNRSSMMKSHKTGRSMPCVL